MQPRIGKPQKFLGTSGRSPLHKIEHLPALHNRRRTVPVSAGKRSSKEKSGRSSQGPLYITIEADGSDLWRLDPVISMLQEGAVSPSLALYAVLPQTKVWHLNCHFIQPSARRYLAKRHAAEAQQKCFDGHPHFITDSDQSEM